MEIPKNTGFQFDFDYRDAYKDLIVGSSESEVKDIDWSPKLTKAYQNWKPFCVYYSLLKKIMFKLGNGDNFSEDGAAIKCGVGKNGTTWNNALSGIKDFGVWLQNDFPNYPSTLTWDDWDSMFRYDKSIDNKLRKFSKLGYWHITPRLDIIKREVQDDPMVVVIGLGKSFGTNSDLVEPPTKITAYHSTVLAGWKESKGYKIDDSLPKGEYYLTPDYPIIAALKITDVMPDNWKEIQSENQKKEFNNCLNHYGKPRNIIAEQVVAGKMVEEFKKFKNESVWQAAGRFWTVYINAIVYGGYTYLDVINSTYLWRRTNNHAFNFNEIKV